TATAQPQSTATPLPQPTNTPLPQPTATPGTRTIRGPATLTSCGSGCDIPGLGIGGNHGESGSFSTSGRNTTLQGPARIQPFCLGPGCTGFRGTVTASGTVVATGQRLSCTGFVDIPPNSSVDIWCTWNISSPSFVAAQGWRGTCNPSAACAIFS